MPCFYIVGPENTLLPTRLVTGTLSDAVRAAKRRWYTELAHARVNAEDLHTTTFDITVKIFRVTDRQLDAARLVAEVGRTHPTVHKYTDNDAASGEKPPCIGQSKDRVQEAYFKALQRKHAHGNT